MIDFDCLVVVQVDRIRNFRIFKAFVMLGLKMKINLFIYLTDSKHLYPSLRDSLLEMVKNSSIETREPHNLNFNQPA